MLKNTDAEGKSIDELAYKEMLMIFKDAKTNYEVFMRNDAAIYSLSLLCDTCNDRLIDGNIVAEFGR